jgi:sugar phosphate isomerase/epimerase
MRKAMSTYVFIRERLHPGCLDTLARGGAEAIEVFGARNHFDYTNRQHVREVANWFKQSGMSFHSMHAPMFSDYEWGRTGTPPVNIADLEKRRRVESMDEIKRALEVAEEAPFRFLIQHVGTPGEEFDPQKFENTLSSLEHLHAFAKPLGVKILLENIPNELATPERVVEYIRALHLDDLGTCLDFGHAHIMGGVEQAFETMKDHIRSTHVHDNEGDRDAHFWPGKGGIDWKQAMRLLRTARHAPAVLLEVNGEDTEKIDEEMKKTYAKLDEADGAGAGA